jgi:hypothetical protein
MNKLTDTEVLQILIGSPSGTTEARFAVMGVPRSQLDRLIKRGKARMEMRTLKHRALKSGAINVPWFYATQKAGK